MCNVFGGGGLLWGVYWYCRPPAGGAWVRALPPACVGAEVEVENPGTMLLASWALWDALEQRMLRAQGLVAPETDPFRLPCPLLLVSGGSPRHTAVRSAARQALTASALAPGTDQTLQQLRDPVRCPTNQYPAPAETVQPTRIPHPDPDLPANQLLTNLRRARKGAAPGPSGPQQKPCDSCSTMSTPPSRSSRWQAK